MMLRFVVSFWKLTKPGVLVLIMFCALVGVALAPVEVSTSQVLLALLGIYCIAAAAGAMNQLLEYNIDKKMSRTVRRPVASGLISYQYAIAFSGLLLVIGGGILWWNTNIIALVLTVLTFLGYSFVYTLFLKPRTSQNIVIGGAFGAMPPVLGWMSVSQEWDIFPWLLFLIIFVWTPVHFWALALYRYDDYQKSGLPMLPVTHGRKFTILQIILYNIILLSVSIMPVALRYASWTYGFFAILFGIFYLGINIRLWVSFSERLAKQSFLFSNLYLVAIFSCLLIDSYFFVRPEWWSL